MPGFFSNLSGALLRLFLVLCVTGAELINSSCSVHERVLARVERVAGRTDFHFDDRILIPIIPLLGFFALGAALSKEAPVCCQVSKDDSAIVFGMDALFHIGSIGSAKIAPNALTCNGTPR